ncbi:DeoR/GlpR family DNA-binding transcription regulator [Teichococcus cervicalis]|uniref:Transcriptional regulator, DeoR family n=1 Tax=Pseudoroseomonas cervicalis ATCC 49957 TaxID=525371 RepID=D5RMY1_9PROT|nr:DeoR/GlpR family DNA-binding transcription regulator [Pseudoroseomonas cervicalis]EFH11346.1 transcriptional regulator, DeoR family [Pseudoroseomonas cervicalis ATCC 49957]
MAVLERQGLTSQRRGERLARLEALLQESGPARLEEAARQLGVSSMTLRRDLARPGLAESRGLALLGGHVVPARASPRPGPYALEREQDQHAAAKRQAAQHAARLVREGDTLFIDCGTTTPHLVQALPPGLALTVVCYALNIATLLARRPNTRLVLLGGLYHPGATTFSSDESLASLRRLRLNTAFLSAAGVDAAQGATCVHFNEVPVKQMALAGAAQRVLVVDGSKLGQLRPAYFAPLSAFSRIVTDASAPEAAQAALRDAGCPLDVAPPAP